MHLIEHAHDIWSTVRGDSTVTDGAMFQGAQERSHQYVGACQRERKKKNYVKIRLYCFFYFCH